MIGHPKVALISRDLKKAERTKMVCLNRVIAYILHFRITFSLSNVKHLTKIKGIINYENTAAEWHTKPQEHQHMDHRPINFLYRGGIPEQQRGRSGVSVTFRLKKSSVLPVALPKKV